ncbi:MAG: ATP-binding protein [Gemmatimonadota bacterium]
MSSPPRMDVRLLGPLEVLQDRERLELPPSRKARALLGYLVATGHAHPRSVLCDLFWQDVHDPRAALRWALSKLRAVVDTDGRPRIEASRTRVRFDGEHVAVDLPRAMEVASGPLGETPVSRLEEAVSAFRGEFLEGLEVPGCHQFEAWCLGMRERTRQAHLSMRRILTEALRDEPARALPHALAWLRSDPLSEDPYIAAMRHLRALGRVGRAVELYERCREVLSDELGASPSPRLERARREVLSPAGRSDRSGGPGGPARADASGLRSDPEGDEPGATLAELPAPEGLPEPGPHDPPLVGREDEIELLTRSARTAGDEGPNTLVISGEPGIGKTRLLRELVRQIRSAGGWALSGTVFETEEIRPYGPWIDLIQALPPTVGGEGAVRRLAAFLSDPGSGSRGEEPTERAQFFEGVARLLGSMAEARAPGLVAVDDAQWLDPSSAALLHYVARTLRDTPLVFALATREEEIDEGSIQARMFRSLQEAGLVRSIPLRRLNASDTGSLVETVHAGADTTRIFFASEGNPLFALAMAESHRQGREHIPATIDEELSHRLDRLESGARSLLPWAAALGRAFDLPTLIHVVERPAQELVDSIQRLEQRGILHATGADRYHFSHSLLRRAAYRRVSAPTRRAIHRGIALTLDRRPPGSERSPGAVAHHAELGGLPELSARAYSEAAERSLWLFALDEAAELVERGLACLETVAEEDRIPLEMALLRIYSFRSMRDRRPEAVEERVHQVTKEAREWGLADVVAVGHATLTELEYQRGAFDEAARSSVRSAEAARSSVRSAEGGTGPPPLAAVRALAKTGSCLLLLDQAPEDARRLTSDAVALAGESGVEMDVVALARALLHHHDGELDDASRAFREVIQLGRRAKDRWWESPALTRMIMVELDRGHPERAAVRAREAEKLAKRLDDETEATFARGLGAVAAARSPRGGGSGTDEGALDAVDEAVRELRTLDSLWSIGHVQSYAAELELERGNPDAARKRAQEVLEAAGALGRPSLRALGLSLAAESAALNDETDRAARHLDAPELGRPEDQLSHRARRALRQARDTLSGLR